MYEYYIISMLAILACGLLCGIASAKVSKAYNKYGKIATRSHMTGYDTARRLLSTNDVRDISIGKVRGHLSDHYHPTKKIVNLSERNGIKVKVSAPIQIFVYTWVLTRVFFSHNLTLRSVCLRSYTRRRICNTDSFPYFCRESPPFRPHQDLRHKRMRHNPRRSRKIHSSRSFSVF